MLTSLGGKKFSRDIRPVDADGNEVSMWAVDPDKENGDEEDSSEEESSEEEEDSDDVCSYTHAVAAIKIHCADSATTGHPDNN